MPHDAERGEYLLRSPGIGARIRVWIESAHPHGLRVAERRRERCPQIETPDALFETDRPNAIVQVRKGVILVEKSWIGKQYRSARNARRPRLLDEPPQQSERLS